MKLISMTKFVLQDIQDSLDKDAADIHRDYAKLLEQPLVLGMFIPVSVHGNILNEPVNYSAYEVGMSGKDFSFNFVDCQEYQEAKDRIFFDGWVIMQRVGDSTVIFNDKSDIIEFINYRIWIFDEYQGNSINDLCFYSEKENIPFTLTMTAQKKIGYEQVLL